MRGQNGWDQHPRVGNGGRPSAGAPNLYNGANNIQPIPQQQGHAPNVWHLNPQQQQPQQPYGDQMSHSSQSNSSYHSENSYHSGLPNYQTTNLWPNNGAPYENGQHPMQQQQYMNYHLNINAPTFVPRGQQGQTYANNYNNTAPSYGGQQGYGMEPQNYYQNQIAGASPNMMQQQFGYEDPGQQDDYLYEQMYSVGAQVYVPSNDLQKQIRECDQQNVITEIQIGFEQLLADPNEFDCWAGAIKDRLLSPSLKNEAIKTALSIAVEMAISGGSESITPMNPTNHQYTFAKLFAFICNGKIDFTLNHLLPVLETYHTNRSTLEKERSENFMMFVAELFEKIEMREKRIQPIGTALMEQVGEIVNLPHLQITDQHMKKIAQILKLTGRHLDAISPLQEELNAVMTRLSGLANGMQKLSESTKALIFSLIEQREKGWGYNDRYSGAVGDSDSIIGSLVGPDGRQIDLSEEERAFLESHFNDGDQQDDGAGASEDPEMLADYEKYLKEVREEEKARSIAIKMQKTQLISEQITEEPETETTEIETPKTETPKEEAKEANVGEKEKDGVSEEKEESK
ncbi:unnamed protein product, partial [Mesorhabditis belari]|uniref:Uncharacterized protein n=1 Tax=Mesorhabditis belari TaxID=2138241 RepID=A0AAF3EUN6_9BILA